MLIGSSPYKVEVFRDEKPIFGDKIWVYGAGEFGPSQTEDITKHPYSHSEGYCRQDYLNHKNVH